MSRRVELAVKRMRAWRAALQLLLILPVVLIAASVTAQTPDEGSIELIDPKVLRVCADPRDLPFSNQSGEGFENKLAEFLAQKLGKTLSYEFYPGATGFVRNTLNAHKCDVIMGMPQGDDIVQGTNPYYRTTYALVSKQGSGLESVDSLESPLLQGKRIGIVAGTPPATNLAVNGLLGNIKSYPLVVDTRFDAPTSAMIDDLDADRIDIAILWGPIAGYLAKHAKTPMKVMPLVKETSGSHLIYRIGMGVRHSDQEWKRLLNKLIAENQDAITHILAVYGVPLLDENNAPLTQ
ncbi:substrate-binding domain-containing protein [Methylocapsa sp. D3K7]|uniref:substrate-binding domain-containing protein n=1 Tax=Methylocapsa sp. D3K7 TaxID=3041435 RepID=UPI00244E7393|nr:substrate-binding domain-containing protein [Methylocapsa sp. D3K7]WGJ14671.1 substrate-binding domain-containing protein [Methylocapsa sp. D3K7]